MQPTLRAQVSGFQPHHDRVRHFALSPLTCKLTECLPAAPILAEPVAAGEGVSGWEAAGGSPPSSTPAATTQGVIPPTASLIPQVVGKSLSSLAHSDSVSDAR